MSHTFFIDWKKYYWKMYNNIHLLKKCPQFCKKRIKGNTLYKKSYSNQSLHLWYSNPEQHDVGNTGPTLQRQGPSHRNLLLTLRWSDPLERPAHPHFSFLQTSCPFYPISRNPCSFSLEEFLDPQCSENITDTPPDILAALRERVVSRCFLFRLRFMAQHFEEVCLPPWNSAARGSSEGSKETGQYV